MVHKYLQITPENKHKHQPSYKIPWQTVAEVWGVCGREIRYALTSVTSTYHGITLDPPHLVEHSIGQGHATESA